MRCFSLCWAPAQPQVQLDYCFAAKGRDKQAVQSQQAALGSFRIGTQISLHAQSNRDSTLYLSGSSSSGSGEADASSSLSGGGSPRPCDSPQALIAPGQGSRTLLIKVILPPDESGSSTPNVDVVLGKSCKDPSFLPAPTHSSIVILQPSDKRQSSRQFRHTLRVSDPDGLHRNCFDTSDKHAQLLQYAVQHGRGIMSLSTFQPGLHHFVMPGIGYITYGMMTNGPDFFNIFTPVALADPVCHPSHYETMARAFLDRFPKAMFMQISASFALVLRSCGLLVNSVGGETRLDLASYSFSGHAKRGLRSAIASAAKQGVRVEEVMRSSITSNTDDISSTGSHSSNGVATPTAADWSVVAAEMKEVDASWVAHKGQHAARVWFMNRLPVFAPEFGVRKFAARDSQGQLLAFIFFDAVYEDGAVVGYYANVTRMRPDAHPGVLNLIMSEFIDRVRSENQLAAPTKKTSVKRSQRKKLEAAAAAAAATSTDAAPAGCIDAMPAATNAAKNSGSSSVRFVSLGLSPLYQMDDSTFKHSTKARRLLEMSWRRGSGFYPFKPLAAAKAKYGGGLHNGAYADPAVTYHQVYLAHNHNQTAAVALFDLGKLLGFWSQPAGAAASYTRYRASAAARKVQKLLQSSSQHHNGQQKGQEQEQP